MYTDDFLFPRRWIFASHGSYFASVVSLFQWLFDANIGYVCQRVCHPLDELFLEPPNGYVLRPLGEHFPAERRLLYPHLAS